MEMNPYLPVWHFLQKQERRIWVNNIRELRERKKYRCHGSHILQGSPWDHRRRAVSWMHRVFVVRFCAIRQVPFWGREVHLRQMLGALLSASDEGQSEEGHAVLRPTNASAQSRFGAASRLWWTQEASNTRRIQKKKGSEFSLMLCARIVALTTLGLLFLYPKPFWMSLIRLNR